MRNKTLPYAKASIATRIARGIKMPKAVYKYAPPMRSKKKIGNTTFIVNSFFPQTGNQTIASKLENLIKADVQKQTVT